VSEKVPQEGPKESIMEGRYLRPARRERGGAGQGGKERKGLTRFEGGKTPQEEKVQGEQLGGVHAGTEHVHNFHQKGPRKQKEKKEENDLHQTLGNVQLAGGTFDRVPTLPKKNGRRDTRKKLPRERVDNPRRRPSGGRLIKKGGERESYTWSRLAAPA